VRLNSDGYEIIAGARRFRAAQLAKLEEMSVRVVQLSDEQALFFDADRLEDDQLPHFALRLALTTHTGIPDENAVDHLTEAEKVFVSHQSKKRLSKIGD
jgi:ParB-like nuclease domain